MKLVVLLVALSSTVASADTTSMKGWELYSWFDMTCSVKPQLHSAPNLDSVCFALLPGTNRTKSVAEIKKAAIGIAALEKRIATLGKNDHVLWRAPAAPFDLPDQHSAIEPRNRAIKALRVRGVQLAIDWKK
jgi:hypothetical protein